MRYLQNKRSLTQLKRDKFRLPMYLAMLVDRVSDHYMVPKSTLMRNLIDYAKGLEELEHYFRMPDRLKFFNKSVQIMVKLNDEDLLFLKDLSEHFGFSRDRCLECVILSSIDRITRILDDSKQGLPDARRKNIFRGLSVPAELHDSIMEIRNDRGESPSLLLREAILGFNKRVASPIESFSKDKRLSLRLLPHEWEKVDVIATSSKLSTEECVASIMIDQFLIEDFGASNRAT